MTVAGILLAAGASRRFGPDDKLLAELMARPLVAHAGDALRNVGCDRLIAVTNNDQVAALLQGYDIVRPCRTNPAQADSLRAAIFHARATGATMVLVALADMPFVTTQHLRAVLDRATPYAPSASVDGSRRMPPACFPRPYFRKLLRLEGDKGAQSILRSLSEDALVTLAKREIFDIDTLLDMVEASKLGPFQTV